MSSIALIGIIGTKIIYKFASRSRPDKFFKAVENINALARHTNYTIIATLDEDDETMNTDEVMQRLCTIPHLIPMLGKSTDKINAINRDLETIHDWDILINMSDDMEFIKEGFDLDIIADWKQLGPDILMHYPDQAAGRALITMAIMDRKYFDRFGYIYHPAYKSLFCDNEQQEVAIKLGRHRFIKKRLFNHNHPAWGLSEKDEQYVKTEAYWEQDKATFHQRKAEGFAV